MTNKLKLMLVSFETNVQHNPHNPQYYSERTIKALHLPVHMDERESMSSIDSKAQWAGIQKHPFIAKAQKQDEQDNRVIFIQNPSPPSTGRTLRKAASRQRPHCSWLMCLYCHDHRQFILFPGTCLFNLLRFIS